MDATVHSAVLKAWQAALCYLQAEMPRAAFDTWVKPTWLVDFRANTFVIGCSHPYGRDWLAGRLTCTLERFLTGVMDAPVNVRFILAETLALVEEPVKAVHDTLSPDESLKLDVRYGSARNSLIEPNRVVRLPTYYLRWLPYVPSQIIFVVMALWQEQYLASSGKPNRGNPKVSVTAEQVCRWAGISRAQFFRLIQPGSAIEWFLKKSETDHERDRRTGRTKKSSNRYTLFETPLTPGDAEDLSAYLCHQGIQEAPVQALQRAIAAEPMSIFRYPVHLPPEGFQKSQSQYLTVQEIVRKLIGHRLDATLMALTDRLADRLLGRGEFILVSWYFLNHWLPLLGPDAAMFVLILRSLCYFNEDTGEIRDAVWIDGGYEAIAQRLGIQSPRTVANWFPARIERGKRKEELTDRTDQEFARRQHLQELLSRFVERTDHRVNSADYYDWKFQVQRGDPLTPQDDAILTAAARFFETAEDEGFLVEVDDWIERMSKDWDETLDGDPKVVLRLSNLANDCSETLKTSLKDCFDTLDLSAKGCFETLLKILKSFKDSIQENDSSTPEDSLGMPNKNPAVEGVTDHFGNWALEKLLSKANVKNRTALLAQKTDTQTFVSWLIYGAAQPSIQNPFSLAISRLIADPGMSAGGASERLAALRPAQLAALIEQELNFCAPTDPSWRRLFGKVPHDRITLLADLLGLALSIEEGAWMNR